MHKMDRLSIGVIFIVTFINCVCSQSCSSSTICMSIYECPPIFDTIKQQQTISPSQAEELRRLACTSGPGRYPYVCCPLANQETVTNAPAPNRSRPRPSNGLGNVLPKKGSCGVESFGEKVYGGRSTALDEFPWMALLEYSKPNGLVRSLSCGGVLINQRYVLTAAHCLVGEIERKIGQLVNVRLGEYDLSTTTDCILGDCADPVMNVGVEEVIPHPGYNDKNPNRTNDIGLVRLAEDVTYTDFVKPICLPSTIGTSRSDVMAPLQVAGWGRTLSSRQSNTKQKLAVPLFDQTACRQKFATANTFIDDSQLCAGGNYIEDTCDGDSGGKFWPLMKFTENYWVVEGIVSFGRSCGLEGWPGVYTRVSSFEDWIKSTMKP
ncbi:Serine protease 7 [Pseudolycoriella hygida]|uniref:CLIP domain-containing serine protease n=1 Tax=Pseudolycoriella hygida TaxID=35572 RepID=A0A9Q0MZQ6_9DIPT|nr:Serine protease 7 [Pseudolycoriella hygida]